MRRFSIVLLMLAASSCLSEKIESASSSAPVPSSRVYTPAEEHALRHMETFYGPSTRSSERSPVGCTISLLTKSGSAGLTANVVNFQNNRGFVVTTIRENGADGSSSSINKAKRYVKNEMGFSDVRKNKWQWEV